MQFDILYEDEFLLAINKPPGLVVHPAPGNWEGTFVNGLLALCHIADNTDPIRPGIVHRLDKETSGVLVAAKSTPILNALCKQFHDRTVLKEYLAIVEGTCTGSHEVRGAIGRDQRHRQKMTIRLDGKEAFTQITALASCQNLSIVKAMPHTGRTHQIRVHLASLGFPVLGDSLYGKKPCGQIPRHMLHCAQICLVHPISHSTLVLKATIPNDMLEIMKNIVPNCNPLSSGFNL